MANPHNNEAKIPDAAYRAAESAEIARLWILDGSLHVSLKKSFEDPVYWGSAFGQTLAHVANIYAPEGGKNREAVIKCMMAELENALAQPMETVSER